jgi:hypothetical protein
VAGLCTTVMFGAPARRHNVHWFACRLAQGIQKCTYRAREWVIGWLYQFTWFWLVGRVPIAHDLLMTKLDD